MSFTKYIGSSLTACFLLVQALGASTIVQSIGNSEASEPLGYYAPYAPYGITPIVYSVEWSQTSTFTDVDVSANLFTSGGTGIVDYTLVTEIGSGTSFAANGIIHGSTATPSNPANVDLFQLSSLGPGTYFLVLDSPVANTSWQYSYPIQGDYTTAPGVTFLGDQWSSGTSINTAYTPGSSFSGTSLPVEFAVTGTQATPEPATFGVTALAILGLAVVVSKSRTRSVRVS